MAQEGGASSGFWGAVTSNIDWCESNYEVTYYIAEFWNTISNVGLIGLSAVGGYEGWRGKQVEFHHIFPFIAMAIVGVGSVLFHMTLIYHFQLLDEMPMIWGTAAIVYAIQQLDKSWKESNPCLAIFLLFWCLISTLIYIKMDDRLIFEGTYGVMVIYAITVLGIRSYRVDRSAIWLFLTAFVFYGAAFTFWTIDRLHCDKLRSLRKSLHPSLHPFSQFHAIWHILVAFGGHSFLLLILRTRFTALLKSYKLGFRFGILPYYSPASPRLAEEGLVAIADSNGGIKLKECKQL